MARTRKPKAPAAPRRIRLSIEHSLSTVPPMLTAWGRVPGGEVALVMRPDRESVVLVHRHGDEHRMWGSEEGVHAPPNPGSPTEPGEAVALVEVMQTPKPREGTVAYRGRWSGVLIWGTEGPVVEVKRRISSYVTLVVHSVPNRHWEYSLERSEKWFTADGSATGEGFITFTDAVVAGLEAAAGLVAPACTRRDTHRRAAIDAEYATKRPVRRPRAPTHRTERYTSRHASPPKSLDEAAPQTTVPLDASAAGALAARVEQEAQDLAAVPEGPWSWEQHPMEAAIAGLDGMGLDWVQEYLDRLKEGTPWPVVEADLKDRFDYEYKSLPATKWKPAKGHMKALLEALRSAPVRMERARLLIRRAQALLDSPLCKGAAKREARRSLGNAIDAYEVTRTALVAGQPVDGEGGLRRVGEWTALAAAKIARACAAGQTALPLSGSKKKACACKAKAKKKAGATPKARRSRTPRAKPATATKSRTSRRRPKATAPAAPPAPETTQLSEDEASQALVSSFQQAIAAFAEAP